MWRGFKLIREKWLQRMKTAGLFCATLLLFYFSIELFSISVCFILTKESPIGKIPVSREEDANAEWVNQQWNEPQSIHPYLGYVQTFDNTSKDHVSSFGFVDTKLPIQKRSPDKVIIGIFGGSVAEGFSARGVKALEKELRKNPGFLNKTFIFLNFGTAGYKQPQQLMILNYVMALGGEFDIIINIDGFNEVALPVAENIPNKTFPFFPRSWHRRVTINTEELLVIAALKSYQEKQQMLAAYFSVIPLRYSNTAYLVWVCLDRYYSSKISQERFELFNIRNSNEAYAITGPLRLYKNDDVMYRDLADVWKNCSLQMSRISGAYGIKYFHFFQPNQYFPNSKKMGKDELRVAIRDNYPYKKPAENGYSYFVDTGKDLVKEGVYFHDFTKIFNDTDEIIYEDACCHYNQKGNDILGKAIGEIIVRSLR